MRDCRIGYGHGSAPCNCIRDIQLLPIIIRISVCFCLRIIIVMLIFHVAIPHQRKSVSSTASTAAEAQQGGNQCLFVKGLQHTVIMFRPVFWTWDAPENHSCPTRGGIFNFASNDRYGPARSVFCYRWGLWTVVIWPKFKIVGNMCTWENTELWGEAAKKAGVLTWSSFRLNSEFKFTL